MTSYTSDSVIQFNSTICVGGHVTAMLGHVSSLGVFSGDFRYNIVIVLFKAFYLLETSELSVIVYMRICIWKLKTIICETN